VRSVTDRGLYPISK